jgi:hypothetical protein
MGLQVWDPISGKNLFRSPDPGIKKAPDPGPCNTAEGEAYRAAVQDSRGPRPAPTRNSSCSHRHRTCTDAAYHSHNWTNEKYHGD